MLGLRCSVACGGGCVPRDRRIRRMFRDLCLNSVAGGVCEGVVFRCDFVAVAVYEDLYVHANVNSVRYCRFVRIFRSVGCRRFVLNQCQCQCRSGVAKDRNQFLFKRQKTSISVLPFTA